MSEKNPIRVFVSHLFDESDDYLRVFEFLESDDRFYYLNVSKPENIPADGGINSIKDEFIAQIKASEAVIVLPGSLRAENRSGHLHDGRRGRQRHRHDCHPAVWRHVGDVAENRRDVSPNTSTGMPGRWWTRSGAWHAAKIPHVGR